MPNEKQARQETHPAVCIIVLNWNGWQDTLECLESLQHLRYPNFDVVVVDNASTNDSVQRIREAYPEIRIIAHDRNAGFAGGNNVGIREALAHGVDYVWLLNNDTTVSQESLRHAVDFAKARPDVGIVGAVLYEFDTPGAIQAWGGGALNARMAITTQFKQPTPDARLGHIVGASMLLRVSMLRQIGLLDESFFFFLEDTELSYRARLHGWKLAVAEHSRVYHKGGSSLKRVDGQRNMRADLYLAESTGVFMGKYSRSIPLAAARALLFVVRRFQRREFDRALPIVRAFYRGLKTSWQSS